MSYTVNFRLDKGFNLMEKMLECFECQDSNNERFTKVSAAVRPPLNC